ncbi:hypothetical protein JCM33374_g5769 [Metschnikowia sp. JCM 33374]|nr:hypothetical protein JCM33374_g5769 [Metschnikowia sp. JCM 33374]
MSLSSNWKALSSKIQPSKTRENKIQKPKRKRNIQSKDVPKSGKANVIAASASTRTLTPLEHALWTCASYSTFEIGVKTSQKVLDYSDKRKSAPGKFVAIDCEFVGVGHDDVSALARVSIVNYYGVVLLDTYVKPEGHVTDWRTWVSGITPQHMRHAIPFKEARDKVENIILDRVVVGHAVHHDLGSLSISVPKHLIRDTAKFPDFRKQNGGKTPGLKKLCHVYLGLDIQSGSHSSVEDAQATMAVFRLYQKAMEAHFAR